MVPQSPEDYMDYDASLPWPVAQSVTVHVPRPETPPIFLESSSSPPKLTRRGNSVPRPRNAFMIFRSEFSQEKIQRSVERDNRHISRIIGHCWNQLPEHDKEIWRQRAAQEKLDHAQKYPGYRFTPASRNKRPKPLKRKVRRNGDEDLRRCQQVAELLLAGAEGEVLETAVKRIDAAMAGDTTTPVASTSTSTSQQDIRGWTPANGAPFEKLPVFRSPLLPPAPLPAETQAPFRSNVSVVRLPLLNNH